ncbi:hypothetical protein [Cupriavidus pinatubonensis]|uniref:hypothetical protein n=1 Tax=Cupriavidus pinatubonensis TaxID=248026 RepID=UPI003593BF75
MSAPGLANPIRLSDTPVTYERAAPTLGEHTDAVLGELGYDAARIAALRKEGVL